MEERVKEINKKLEHAIETENEKEAENLVNLLAKEKGFVEEISMPKNFAKEIEKEKGRRIMANKSRVLKVAAASLAAVCALGGTTYAATHWNFDKVQFVNDGIMVVDDKNKDVKVEDSVGSSAKFINSEAVGDATCTTIISGEGAEDIPETKSAISEPPEIKEKDRKVETLKEQKGTKDTNWSYMVKKLRTTPGYGSDDGKNWEQTGWDKYYYTNYTYDTWEKFRADKVMPVVFNEKAFEGFALDDSKILYKEEQFKFLKKGKQSGEEKEEASYKSYEATYLNGKKKMEIKLQESEGYKEIKDDDSAEYYQVIFPPADDGKAENQRHYTTKKNVKYALEDVKRDKKKATFAYLSGNGYSISLIFTNMSEKEIHNVLDTIDATELLK